MNIIGWMCGACRRRQVMPSSVSLRTPEGRRALSLSCPQCGHLTVIGPRELQDHARGPSGGLLTKEPPAWTPADRQFLKTLRISAEE